MTYKCKQCGRNEYVCAYDPYACQRIALENAKQEIDRLQYPSQMTTVQFISAKEAREQSRKNSESEELARIEEVRNLLAETIKSAVAKGATTASIQLDVNCHSYRTRHARQVIAELKELGYKIYDNPTSMSITIDW